MRSCLTRGRGSGRGRPHHQQGQHRGDRAHGGGRGEGCAPAGNGQHGHEGHCRGDLPDLPEDAGQLGEDRDPRRGEPGRDQSDRAGEGQRIARAEDDAGPHRDADGLRLGHQQLPAALRSAPATRVTRGAVAVQQQPGGDLADRVDGQLQHHEGGDDGGGSAEAFGGLEPGDPHRGALQDRDRVGGHRSDPHHVGAGPAEDGGGRGGGAHGGPSWRWGGVWGSRTGHLGRPSRSGRDPTAPEAIGASGRSGSGVRPLPPVRTVVPPWLTIPSPAQALTFHRPDRASRRLHRGLSFLPCASRRSAGGPPEGGPLSHALTQKPPAAGRLLPATEQPGTGPYP